MKQAINITKVETTGEIKIEENFVPQEVPITVSVNQREIVTFLCTPTHLKELATGYLIGEGLLSQTVEISGVFVDEKCGTVNINTDCINKTALETLGKRYLTSGCGGGTSFYHLMDKKTVKVESQSKFSLGDIISAKVKLQKASRLYSQTGSVHACGIFSEDKLLVVREDIGRHNAADKVLGWYYSEGLPPCKKFFVTTGRLSSEILLKVAKAGIPLIASGTGPTSLAVELAQELDVTIIGYLKKNRANIYTCPNRISV